MQPQALFLTLVDPNPDLCEEFSLFFGEFSQVDVVHGHFESLSAIDCMVSAANSFGLMDGGVDLAITNFFGLQLMDRVQEHILTFYRGEQPVGTSFVIATHHQAIPFVAHTPTMRVPMSISMTDNVYNAMWAMLLAVWQHNLQHPQKIRRVACPGLGALSGCVELRSVARQMSTAFRHFLDPPTEISWPYVRQRQQAIGLGGDTGFFQEMKRKKDSSS